MALAPTELAWIHAVAKLPPMPRHYYTEFTRFLNGRVHVDVCFKGDRIFEIVAETHSESDADTPCSIRYAARAVRDNRLSKRASNQPNPWVEYPDLPTLMQAMLVRHRLGADT